MGAVKNLREPFLQERLARQGEEEGHQERGEYAKQVHASGSYSVSRPGAPMRRSCWILSWYRASVSTRRRSVCVNRPRRREVAYIRTNRNKMARVIGAEG